MNLFRGKLKRSSNEGRASTPTRVRVFDCIRHQCNTIEDIAQTLGITDNAVRAHVAALEEGGMIRRVGVAHRGTAGQPPAIYELTETAEESQSRAYAPVLAACMEEIGQRLPPQELRTIMQGVGHRLASTIPRNTGSLEQRIYHAAAVLEGVGGAIVTTSVADGTMITGHSCPLATAVAREPITCSAIQTLLADLTGVDVVEQCDHTDRPRCRFLVPSRNSKA